MLQKNRYLFRGRISERKFRDLLRLFALDIPADRAADFTGLNHKTAAAFYTLLRQRMAELTVADCPFRGQVEIDESYFGPTRTRGHKGRPPPQQGAGLRHPRTRWPPPLPDRRKLFEINAPGDHRGSCRPLRRGHFGRVHQL